ncbi:MAG: rhodanese-like domain-containing protein [Acidimicrobiales bacterium]|nr:rhodanese-like domain-containing protein [Acidimicrobiales bacterium]
MTIPATDTISTAELQRLRVDDPTTRVLDVRTGGEFETVHIPGSFNVPLDTLGEHVADLADVAHPVVLVCQSGGRASQAHGALRGAGKERLHILEGGIAAWQAADGEVAQGDVERWAMDRQVRLVAGSLVVAGVLTSIAVPKAKWLAAGVGGGLLYSAVSNTCAMANMLGRLPYNRTSCDIESVLRDLHAEAA